MGSNKADSLRLRAMVLEFFDPETGQLIEKWNLGRDFRLDAIDYYHQRDHDTFSVRSGKIESRFYHPKLEYSPPMVSREVLRIAMFYNKKFGIDVELEGCMKDGKLYVWQVSESPLPKDILTGLSNVPEQSVLFKTDYGRGTINHSGHIIIKEGTDYGLAVKKFDGEGVPYLVIGFDDSVTLENRFLYFATVESISRDAARLTHGERTNFVRLTEHMNGMAAQTTFNAAQNDRQGGMYYLEGMQPKDLLEALKGSIDFVDGVKVIRNVRVEAHREGMQIYRL